MRCVALFASGQVEGDGMAMAISSVPRRKRSLTRCHMSDLAFMLTVTALCRRSPRFGNRATLAA